MRTLLGERYAPITTSVGFLHLGLDESVRALESWRRRLYDEVKVTELAAGFPEVLHRLEPLVGGARPRELLVEVAGGWTAYFDCGLQGTDAVSAIGHLASAIPCSGLVIMAAPHTLGRRGLRHGQYGSVQFELFGPNATYFLNYVRSIVVAHDGSRWIFETSGQVQPFEEPEAYRSRRIRDRFTSSMLERYCRALGVDPFNEAAYGPRAVLIESSVVIPADGYIMTLQQVQDWLEIVPGLAEGLPG